MRRFGRLRKAGEIAHVRRRGRAYHFTTLTAYCAPADRSGAIRVGVVASKAVGGAVVRNLVRRRIRGVLDSLPVPPAGRVLFVAKPAAAMMPYAALARDVVAAVAGPL